MFVQCGRGGVYATITGSSICFSSLYRREHHWCELLLNMVTNNLKSSDLYVDDCFFLALCTYYFRQWCIYTIMSVFIFFFWVIFRDADFAHLRRSTLNLFTTQNSRMVWCFCALLWQQSLKLRDTASSDQKPSPITIRWIESFWKKELPFAVYCLKPSWYPYVFFYCHSQSVLLLQNDLLY